MDEDDTHEFKMHRIVCLEEISTYHEARSRNKIVRTKQPASKLANNSFSTFAYTCDHLLLSLHDTLGRFKPPVPPERVSLQFLTVDNPVDDFKPESAPLTQQNTPTEQRRHVIRTSNCWCEKETTTTKEGSSTPRYLVVIAVSPWNRSRTQRGSVDAIMPPVFQNEEGLCYKRRAASNANWSIDAICQVTEDVLTVYYEDKRERLEKQIVDLNDRYSWCSVL
uniref:Uncharacterized protein n=1 Tax=Plectus sambesii TaxID=2011161 RepID=A0A914W0X3_9BILA